MEFKSSTVKKTIRDTCDSISKTLSSPPSKKIKINTYNEQIEPKKINENQLPSFLFSVNSVQKNQYEDTIVLNLLRLNDDSKKPITCTLHDSWSSSNVEENDLIHILADVENDGNYVLKDSKGLLIVNPHFILSGTTVLSALHCLKKATLNWKFKEIGSNSTYMVLGTLLHNLFQSAIKNKKYSKVELNELLIDLLKKRQIINQLYDCNLDEESVLKDTVVYLTSIEKWLQENVLVNRNKISQSNLHISEICDIEESIWSPKYGIKGKLDLTLKSEIKVSAFKPLTSLTKKENLNQIQTHVIPVELKSGRTTFSVEHEGQVMLYSLLNQEKRKQSDFGLLLYLKDMNMKFIKVNHGSLRGLIQLRNELVHHISANKLPEFKNEDRICSKCPMLTVCSLLSHDKISSNDSEIYLNSIQHLTDDYKKYFFHWYKMLELEFQDYKQFESGETVWWKSVDELESIGLSVFNLKLESNTKYDSDEYTGEGFFLYNFTIADRLNKKVILLKENDMILLSSLTDNLVGISQGFIKSIDTSKTKFGLLLDKNLKGFESHHLFRIDKINFRSAINLNYTNLSRLMNQDDRSSKLRSCIIDRTKPKFDKTLVKQHILENKPILKKLNQSQQASILKALMAQDYLLIKGYPGTGKTTTIAALIAILVNLGKKVLFTSFTNSAVDNLLLKILHDYQIDFVRIGSYERIHQEIQRFESNSMTSNIKTVQELDYFYKQKKLIATTCSSIGNTVFNKIDFDYCIVDEASQVLLTTCLGPLFISRKFVLVGDLEQLPPIIRNKEARALGMGVSLFEWLDSKEGSVELVHQYRMNKEIMDLANEITYEGKLECLSSTTANSAVVVCTEFLSSLKSDKMRKIFSESVIFIDTSEIMKCVKILNSEDSSENRLLNMTECDIVNNLTKIFFKVGDFDSAEDIGIIAPYNNQVNEIRSRFSNQKFYQDIEVNTVDQFQGRDKKMIMMSFTNSVVKTEETKEYEILNDKRRLTVGITRAKQKLILIGCVENLLRYKPVSQLINALKMKDLIITPKNLNELKFDE